MPSFPDLRVPLSDGVVAVRPAAERDIPEILIAYQDDPELQLRIGSRRPPSGAELGRRAERAEHDRLTGQSLSLTLVQAGGDTCIGQIDVSRVDWEHDRATLGIWVAPGARGRGLARRALALVGPWLLAEAGLERVELLVEPGHEAMLKAARAAGFEPEGLLRGYHRRGSGRLDMTVLSLVRRDLRG